MFMGLSSWHSHRESSPGSFNEYRLRAGWPPTLRPNQPIWAVSPPIGCYHPQTPSPFITITQLVSSYSFYCVTEGGRLSRPRHCSRTCIWSILEVIQIWTLDDTGYGPDLPWRSFALSECFRCYWAVLLLCTLVQNLAVSDTYCDLDTTIGDTLSTVANQVWVLCTSGFSLELSCLYKQLECGKGTIGNDLQALLPRVAPGHPLSPLSGRGTPFPPCPFTSPSFALFYLFLFSLVLTIFFLCPSLSFLPE